MTDDLTALFAGQAPRPVGVSLRAPGGETVWVYDEGSLLAGAPGHPLYVQGSTSTSATASLPRPTRNATRSSCGSRRSSRRSVSSRPASRTRSTRRSSTSATPPLPPATPSTTCSVLDSYAELVPRRATGAVPAELLGARGRRGARRPRLPARAACRRRSSARSTGIGAHGEDRRRDAQFAHPATDQGAGRPQRGDPQHAHGRPRNEYKYVADLETDLASSRRSSAAPATSTRSSSI